LDASRLALPSNLVELGRLHDRVLPGDLLPSGGPVVEPAGVRVRVPVRAAERAAAPAQEPRQPHLPPARLAPVRRRRRLIIRGILLLRGGGCC
jgi:hypothetical protein